MLGNFLSCRKGVKNPVEVPEVSFDWPRDASAEMGLILPGGENILDFLELWQVLSTYDGDFRDPLWWPQERPVPMRAPADTPAAAGNSIPFSMKTSITPAVNALSGFLPLA